LADDQFTVKNSRGSIGFAGLEGFEQFAGGGFANGIGGLADDRQGRVGNLRPGMVVKADNGDIPRAVQPHLLQAHQGAQTKQIVADEHRRRMMLLGHQLSDSPLAILNRERAGKRPAGAQRQVRLSHRPLKA